MLKFVVALLWSVVVVAGEPARHAINWETQVIRSSGSGAPDLNAANQAQARAAAEKVAIADAQRSLRAALKAVRVDATRTVDDLLNQDEAKARLETRLKAARVATKRYYSDNGVDLELELPMALFTDLFDADATSSPPRAAAPGTSTGVIIDARGLKLTPALAPRLLDDAGKPIYSVDSLSKDARKTSGVAVWFQSLDEAKKTLKAGEKPLLIKAAKVQGVDLTLSADDSKKVATLGALFADGKVIIVVN